MKNNKLKKPMIIIGIIILVIVIIGVIALFIFNSNKTNKETQTESVEMQKNYEKIANSKEMIFTTTLDENNKETIVIKDDQAYKETTRNGVTYKYIVKGNDTYFVDDSNKTYYTYKNNTEISVNEKRIYAPTIVGIVDGKAQKSTTGISSLQKEPYMKLTPKMNKESTKNIKEVLKLTLPKQNKTCQSRGKNVC